MYVVGCGGTGGWVAESLCRILPVKAIMVLVDDDTVEFRNLTRQNFYPEDLDKCKSEVLAHRLSNKYNRPIGYSTLPIKYTETKTNSIIIGCVDNGQARRDIAAKFKANYIYTGAPKWWIDSGNGENFGQVLIGNSADDKDRFNIEEQSQIWRTLPLPTLQRSDLLRQARKLRNCADIQEQGPTINQSMAVLVTEVVRRLILGTCPWMQLYLDMEKGTMLPVYATPENVTTMVNKIIRKGG